VGKKGGKTKPLKRSWLGEKSLVLKKKPSKLKPKKKFKEKTLSGKRLPEARVSWSLVPAK